MIICNFLILSYVCLSTTEPILRDMCESNRSKPQQRGRTACIFLGIYRKTDINNSIESNGMYFVEYIMIRNFDLWCLRQCYLFHLMQASPPLCCNNHNKNIFANALTLWICKYICMCVYVLYISYTTLNTCGDFQLLSMTLRPTWPPRPEIDGNCCCLQLCILYPNTVFLAGCYIAK